MRIALIHNPSAGEGHPSRDELLSALRYGGVEANYRSVEEDNWQSVLRRPSSFDAVVVAGGDGTIRKVVHAVAGSAIPIAIIPLGTANNIARSLGAHADASAITTVLKSGMRITLDLGHVDGLEEDSLFMEGIGIGFLADTMQAVDHIKHSGAHEVVDEKRAALEMLRMQVEECTPMEVELHLDGRDCSGRYLMVQVMNIGCAGSNVLLAPDADPADGWFDVVLAPADEQNVVLAYVEALLGGDRMHPPFRIERARRVTMAWRGSSLHVDDQLWPSQGQCPSTRLEVRMDPAKVDFLITQVPIPQFNNTNAPRPL